MKTPLNHLYENVVSAPRVLLLALVFVASAVSLRAQDDSDQVPSAQSNASPQLSQDDLNDLLGPIALYPDALVAMILPASTVPADITLADRFLDANGVSAPVDDQQWDDSVKGLAKYPDVLKWMDQNLEWTQSLGEAFVEQPAEVMDTIQQLRAKARAEGNLVDSPQQSVEVQPDNSIQIVPSDPQVIYVPVYDPEVVYVQTADPGYGPLITFGTGCAAGAWLNYDFNWGQRRLYHGNGFGWSNLQRRSGGGNNAVAIVNNTTINNVNVSRWQPSATSVRQVNLRQQKHFGNAALAGGKANGSRAVPTNGEVRVPKPARSTEVRQGYSTQPRVPAAADAGGNQRRVNPYGYDQPAPANSEPVKRTEIRPREAAPVVPAPARTIDRPAVREPLPQVAPRPEVAPREHVEVREPQHPAEAGGQHPSSSGGGGEKKGDGKKKKDNN